jgi:hypothetical protein
MRKSILIGAAFTFSTLVGVAQAKDYTGEIMDSACAQSGSHAGMEKEHNLGNDSKACTQACVKAGSKYVLYMNGKSYALDNQTKPADYAGQKVKVNGSMKGDTIHVDSISPAT